MKKKFLDQWPRCAEHQDYTYQYINLSQKCTNNRLQCSECLYSVEKNQQIEENIQIFPLSIALNSPELLINFMKKDVDGYYIKEVFQICEKNMDQLFYEQILKLELIIRTINQVKDEIKSSLYSYKEIQDELKKLKEKFLDKCQFNSLQQLIFQLKKTDKQIKSHQYQTTVTNINRILDQMLKDDCQFYTLNINEFRENHKQMNLNLKIQNNELIELKITQLIKEHRDFFEQLNRSMNWISNKNMQLQYENKFLVRMQVHDKQYKSINFSQINQNEQVIHENQQFQLIDDEIQATRENRSELLQLQENPQVLFGNFQIIWKYITDTQLKQMDLLFHKHSQKQYQNIFSTFYGNAHLNCKDYQIQQYFIEKIIKNSPFNNQQVEKEKIMETFQNVLGDFQQFQILDAKNEYRIIFDQPIIERLQGTSDQDILNMNAFYQFQLNYIYFTQQDLLIYLKNQFYDDFIYKLSELRETERGRSLQHFESEIQQFFMILSNLHIHYDTQSLTLLIKTVENWFNYTYSFYKNMRICKAFSQLQQSIQIKAEQFVQKEKISLKQLQYLYPSLIILNKTKYFPDYSSLQTFIHIITNDIIIIYYDYLIIPIENNDKGLQYIADQNDLYYKNIFRKEFLNYFSQNMNQKKGWNKLYYQLYDLIVAEMSCHHSQYNNLSLKSFESQNDDFSSNENSLKLLMSKIKIKVVSFNRQFAKFGVILNNFGERCIYYYSLLLIWRFSSFTKWRKLKDNFETLKQQENFQFKNYLAHILENKIEQSRLKARAFAANLYTTFIENYYS